MLRGVLLVLLLWVSSLQGWAQQDSLYTDTIVVVKDPHVVKRKIYTYDSSRAGYKLPISWGLELYSTFGKSPAPKSLTNVSTFAKTQSNHCLQLLLSLRKWEVEAGVGILNSGYDQRTQWENHYSTTIEESIRVLLDSYDEEINGETTRHEIWGIRDTTYTIQHTDVYYTSASLRSSHLQLPFGLGRRFALGQTRWYLLPRVQCVYLKRMNFDAVGTPAPPSSQWNMAFELNMGYEIGKNWSVMAKVRKQGGGNVPTNTSNGYPWSYGIGLSFLVHNSK